MLSSQNHGAVSWIDPLVLWFRDILVQIRILGCCGSGMFIRILIFTHPGSRILEPKKAAKESGEKKFVVIPFFVATNSHN
jgi:hypothetical protein